MSGPPVVAGDGRDYSLNDLVFAMAEWRTALNVHVTGTG
jgi:hypothetical protein